MTAKEKAIELVEKFIKIDIEVGGQYDGYLTMKKQDAKQCALISVDEVLQYIQRINTVHKGILNDSQWKEIKKEIELL